MSDRPTKLESLVSGLRGHPVRTWFGAFLWALMLWAVVFLLAWAVTVAGGALGYSDESDGHQPANVTLETHEGDLWCEATASVTDWGDDSLVVIEAASDTVILDPINSDWETNHRVGEVRIWSFDDRGDGPVTLQHHADLRTDCTINHSGKVSQ